jgi:hypothetical protein
MIAPASPSDLIRVKFLSRIGLPDLNIGSNFLRRFPKGQPIWGRCEFIFDQEARDYDWLVVYDDLSRSTPIEPLSCPQNHTLLLTGEPSSITVYGRAFLRQFGHVLTSQEPEALQHPNAIRRQAGLLWYYGGSGPHGSYDSLIAAKLPTKSKDISSVCSTKAMSHTLHARRLKFTQRLMRDMPELAVFGYGMNSLKDKADALDPYKYHLVIENHSSEHHWTEKLADAYLGFCLPIYFGCTNVADYFPPESFVQIDIRNYEGARDTIKRVILENVYERRLPAIIEARRRVLQDYATFPQLARLIEERHQPVNHQFNPGRILGRRYIRRSHPIDTLLDLFNKVRRKLHRG